MNMTPEERVAIISTKHGDMVVEFYPDVAPMHVESFMDAWAMIPVKIKDTDPQSGLIVWSTARVESKEGDVWEADVSETYFFDLDGKISSVTQYAKPVSSDNNSEE